MNALPKIPNVGGVAISKVTLVKPVQPLNALAPMFVTLSGMTMLVKPVQPWNALSPMLVTLLGMVMLVKAVQPENILLLMVVKAGLFGNVTLVKLRQFMNAI